MDRRQFILGTGACALPVAARAALAVPASGVIGFKVFRNGSPIGEHHLDFSTNGDALTVSTNAALLVTVAGIPVFRYGVQATERWQAGVFQSLDSKVNANGNPLQVHASRVANGYEVEGTNQNVPAKTTPRYLAPANLLPLTHWNKQMMYGTILNIQTAHSYPVRLSSQGWNKLPTANGGSIVAQRFDLSGKLVISEWYDMNNAWSSLEFHKSGDITYQKITA